MSVVVLTASGATHLPGCLDSLRQHSWPADRTEVIVVDNGSPRIHRRRSSATIRAHALCGPARTLVSRAGTTPARGSRPATGWSSSTTTPASTRDWLDEMMGVARRRERRVGRRVHRRLGRRARGLRRRAGQLRGTRLRAGLRPAGRGRRCSSERPLLFGCGAAVLFRRDAFEESGGWDEPTFAYYEDVEFGWRLWLLGHEVWFAPKAIVYHRHHGTSGSESPARVRAFERNALRMLYSLLEEDSLQQVLPAALLLAVDRGAARHTVQPRRRRRHRAARRMASLRGGCTLRVVKTRLLHALSRRGARRQIRHDREPAAGRRARPGRRRRDMSRATFATAGNRRAGASPISSSRPGHRRSRRAQRIDSDRHGGAAAGHRGLPDDAARA